MIGLKVKKKRFTLLYLEETEVYVQDLTGSCTYWDFQANSAKYELHSDLLITHQKKS
jgi:hypothetical protein